MTLIHSLFSGLSSIERAFKRIHSFCSYPHNIVSQPSSFAISSLCSLHAVITHFKVIFFPIFQALMISPPCLFSCNSLLSVLYRNQHLCLNLSNSSFFYLRMTGKTHPIFLSISFQTEVDCFGAIAIPSFLVLILLPTGLLWRWSLATRSRFNCIPRFKFTSRYKRF